MDQDVLDDHLSASEEYPNANDYDQNLHGLTGWLAFLGFSIVISLLATVILNLKNYSVLLNRFGELQSSIKVWIAVEVVMVAVLIVLQFALLFFYFNKKKLFPKMFLGYLVYYLLFTVLDNMVIVSMVGGSPDGVSVIRPFVYAAIWFTYIRNSKQVKHTFLF